ncbi:HesA/MoeB/ThiF family protein [Novosphingopyxis iocasae]|uniref:HesA/MoeB/ThiF family protein n=1 Tax=Novosphingopyxis iocasae TaxID=2762729 RepID=UPI00165189B2|nr:HesA/MoeB/ThiF family protein [Novosphingopyxis iocasae]
MITLTDNQLDRYARHIVLREIGGSGQKKLLGTHILIVGAGGIGCPAIQYLAAAGIGRLTIVDPDTVSLSNLQRQPLYGEQDVDAPKAGRAADAVRQLNPDVSVTAITEAITTENAATLLAEAAPDIVLDGTDNFATRLVVSDACVAARIPLVSAAIGMFQGQVGSFYGHEAEAPCYRCFVGDAHDADDCDTCADQGVLGAMCGMVGGMGAMEAIRAVAGFGEDARGKLHVIDGLKPSMYTMRLPKDPNCQACGTNN